MRSPQFAVLVPVKPPAQGKSRLVGTTEGLRRELAAAFALDTVAACLAARRVEVVLAVTDDASFAGRLTEAGCAAVPDGVAGDLNATLRQAAAEARRRWPGLLPAAVCADLPALRPADLDAALTDAPAGAPGFVADAAGIGTTMYAAPHDLFDPRFGVGSRLAHLGAGATEIGGELRTLRHDVDELDDLHRVLGLGVGPQTAAAAAEVRTQ